jgi:hypothetical protein
LVYRITILLDKVSAKTAVNVILKIAFLEF